MKDPAPVDVPCPRCDGTISVLARVEGDRLKLDAGGSCEDCGLRVFTAGELVVASE
ncbi:hypothetical protein [Leifsonia sp. AG29]|uniref:hypothetical protein n=1 Tax=Leifsonia sp. AG29 TaxID=2598860 RepID=UPI00131BEEDF|nr:hypothetical protein [Leifsonia sp. AG29]